MLFGLNAEPYVWGKSNNKSQSNCLLIFPECWWLHHGMGMLDIGKYWRVPRLKTKQDGAKHRQNRKTCLSDLHQTLGEEFTFQQDNNLQHYAKFKLELLTKKTVNVLESPLV
jgi:hypothetical protein